MDEIQILERYYNGFINQETPSGFFNGLIDYLEYADGVQSFDYITTLLLKKGEPLKEKVDSAAKKAVVRLDSVRKGLGKYLEKRKIEDEGIKKLFQDYDVVRERNTNNVNQQLATALHETLSHVIEALASMPTCKPDVAQYIQYYKDSGTVSQFLSLHEMRELFIVKGEYEAAEKNELWGQVPLLGQIFQVIKKGKKHQLSLQVGYKVFSMTGLDAVALNILVSEWEAVRDGKMPKMLNGSPRPKPMLFGIEKIKPIASRLHLYLLNEYADYEKMSNRLTKETEDKKRAESEIPVKNGAIYIDGLSRPQTLFVLRMTLSHMFKVLEAVSTGNIGLMDTTLNAVYIMLFNNLSGFLDRKDFEDLKEKTPELLPKHLFEDGQELDILWEDGGRRDAIMRFIGDVEAEWVRAGMPSFILPKMLEEHFSTIEEIVGRHLKEKSLAWDKTVKNIETMKERGDFAFTPLQPQHQNGAEAIQPEKIKSVPMMKIIRDTLAFGKIRIPMERGQMKMAELFLNNAKVYRGKRMAKSGKALGLEVYRKAGMYGSEGAFRDALKKFRGKLNTAHFPAKVENPQTRYYQMVIRYVKQRS